MTTAEMIKELCGKWNISVSERWAILARLHEISIKITTRNCNFGWVKAITDVLKCQV